MLLRENFNAAKCFLELLYASGITESEIAAARFTEGTSWHNADFRFFCQCETELEIIAFKPIGRLNK